MYKILLLFSSFYSLSLSLSLHHRAATKRQEMEGEREREPWEGKIVAKPMEEEKERVCLSFELKNEFWCECASCVSFFSFFLRSFVWGRRESFFFFFLLSSLGFRV
jgi:hypothetical protein